MLEACEYRRHFLRLSPHAVVLLGIEADHFDCYPTLADAEEAYRELAQSVPTDGLVLYRSDCPVTQRVVQGVSARTVSFSLTDPDADWRATDIRTDGMQGRFRIGPPDATCEQVEVALPIPGQHQVLNALAACACAMELGVDFAGTLQGIMRFTGLKRRFERVGERFGGPVIDDYAHHPTEIRATLTAAREAFPGRRIVCLFQPHQISRTEQLFEELARALELADRVYLLPVFSAREVSGARQVTLARALVERINAGCGPAKSGPDTSSVRDAGSGESTSPAAFIESLDHVWTTLQTNGEHGSTILTLGAGDLTRIHHEFS